jgi:hypothetical protein
MDRGNFFHSVYRIEQKLGRMFRELKPYPLFPLDDYFHGPSRLAPAFSPVSHRESALQPRLPPIGKTA